jgi:GNAT superfamily N-acetyltransferase
MSAAPEGGIEIRPMRAGELRDVVALWSRSKKRAYPWLAIEQARGFDEELAFFRDVLAPRCAIWLAYRGGALAGLIALDGRHVEQLYVEPDAQGTGVGSALLAEAKRLQPAGLSLFTFQRNARARAFYEARGFRAVRFGVSPAPESEPDVRYEWP